MIHADTHSFPKMEGSKPVFLDPLSPCPWSKTGSGALNTYTALKILSPQRYQLVTNDDSMAAVDAIETDDYVSV